MSAGATGYAEYNSHVLARLVAKCEAENAEVAKRQRDSLQPGSVVSSTKPWDAWEFSPLVCDPASLSVSQADKYPPGIQRDIVATARREFYDPTRMLAIAVLIAAASALPWLWYFLLRRVSELAAAFRGKPPEQ